jgi:isovaleryl-CoA dehydrogenase
MNFEWTVEQWKIHRAYRAIGLRYVRTTLHDGFDADCWSELTAAGMWRIPVPRECGGSGGSWLDFTAAFEGIVGAMRSTGFAMAVANQATVIRALLNHANPVQRARYLAPLLDGAICATAISERGTGTEVRALQTMLRANTHGYLLDGHKYNISHAPTASLLLVAARFADGAREPTVLVLLDPTLAGATRSPAQQTMGNRNLPIGDMEFASVQLDDDCMLGMPRDGLRNLMDIASMNRAYFGLLCAQSILPFLNDALAYAKSREALGVTLDAHQHVQRRLVDIRIGIERTRWMSLAALGQLLSRHPDAFANCSIAKLTGAQDLSSSALDLLRLYGSAGYRSAALASFVADTLGMLCAGGTDEMHRRNIFAQMQRQADLASEPSRVEATATGASHADLIHPSTRENLVSIEPGLKAHATHRVNVVDLADQWGGEAHALASPIMIIFIEKTCMAATDHLLDPTQMTVGYNFEIRHLAPTPPDWEVTVDAELIAVEDRMMTYRVTVSDAAGVVGEGVHIRCVVSKTSFHERIAKRRDSVAIAQ